MPIRPTLTSLETASVGISTTERSGGGAYQRASDLSQGFSSPPATSRERFFMGSHTVPMPDADGLFTLETTGARLFMHITSSLQGGGLDPKWGEWAGSALHAMLCAAQLAGLSADQSWELERFCYAPKLTGESVAMVHEVARLAEVAIPGIAYALTAEMERISRA